ncbi:MAG TPA: DUF883 C-terminal domain-containing protein [Burkholderiales bacterium]|nr:DUF883 C-terminal domain-containing protein [Burkholderiales bacterium]
MAETKRSIETNVDRLSQSAHEAVDKAASYAERVSAKGERLMEMQEDWFDTAREYVREKPLQALGIALAAGYLLHMITRR